MSTFQKITFSLFLLLTPSFDLVSQSLLDSLYLPVDYAEPTGDKFYLYYEFGKEFDPDLPTVFAIADGQQYWARPGTAARFQKDFFGDQMNVLVLFGRATSNEVSKHFLNNDNSIRWDQAYRLLKASQWIEDIESVRRAVSPTSKINLYGRSGGGLLLLQYLNKYGMHVEKAFCQTPVVHNFEYELGYRHDRFWEEINAFDPTLGKDLLQAMSAGVFERDDVMLSLQRQNFFVEADEIDAQRKVLIDVLKEQNLSEFDSLKKKYQVDRSKKLKFSAPSSSVRLYEFYMGGGFDQILKESSGTVRPDLESMLFYAELLVKEFEAGIIERPQIDFSMFHELETQVFIFAGRWDHTADYRGQYYLSGLLPKSILFMADDNHVFSSIYQTNNYGRLVQHALLYDKDSPQMKEMLKQTKNLIWDEWKK